MPPLFTTGIIDPWRDVAERAKVAFPACDRPPPEHDPAESVTSHEGPLGRQENGSGRCFVDNVEKPATG